MDALVIGAGPAGLMAAEELARAGRHVVLAEAKPSVGRKFLMAGKSGLNLTKDEGTEAALRAYAEAAGPLGPILRAFGPEAVQDWARGLGQEVFTGSSGRVFPVAMKASPLLRAWLGRLGELGVELRVRHRWTGWEDGGFVFDTPEGRVVARPGVAVLALGGSSWARLGSDGAWVPWLDGAGRGGDALRARQCRGPRGLEPAHGAALRSAGEGRGDPRGRQAGARGMRRLREGARGRRGLCRLAGGARGGGPGAGPRPGPERGGAGRAAGGAAGKESLPNHLRKRLGLDPVKLALLMEFGRPLPEGAALAALVKALPVRHAGLRPMDEAISTAGGVRWEAVDAGLMLKALPGVFVAGEMLDWEAPTGGYLLTACLATGRWAGQAAARAGTGSA
jgi:predicted flavoprotein YhiN